jgi:hypothetical protein
MTRFWNNLHQVRLKAKDWKAKKFKLWDNKTKRKNVMAKNRRKSPMSEGDWSSFNKLHYMIT